METRLFILSDLSSNFSLSFRGTSSSSSVYGQGSFSAKVIKTLGSLVVRGLDQLIIQRRLSYISAQVSSQTSGQESIVAYGRYSLSPYAISPTLTSGPSASKWCDILELSRRDLYANDIRRQALNRILVQLETGNFHPLIEILSKWQSTELHILLFELMACLPDERLDAFTFERSPLHESIRSDYEGSSTVRKEQITRAFVRAIKLLLLAGRHAADTVIDAGFLTVILLLVAAEGIHVPLCTRNDSAPSLTLLECKEALTVLTLYEDLEFKSRLASWPFILFWPQARDFELPGCFMSEADSRKVLPDDSLSSLSEAWRLRLSSIDTLFAACRLPGYNLGSYLRTALAELVWLLSFSKSDSSLQAAASASLFNFLALGPKRWRIFGDILTNCSFEVITLVFRNLISALQNSSNPELHLPNDTRVDDYFLEFCTSISRDFPILIDPLIEGGIASLLLSIICELDPTHSYSTCTSLDADWATLRRQLLRDATSKLAVASSAAPKGSHYDHDKTMRILHIGVIISVSLSMMESQSSNWDIQNDHLWKQATKTRLRPVLSSALQDIWMLLACAGERARTTQLVGREQAGQASVRRLLICFQILAVIFDVNVYAMTSHSKGEKTSAHGRRSP